jgi:hypothetical protein
MDVVVAHELRLERRAADSGNIITIAAARTASKSLPVISIPSENLTNSNSLSGV